MPTGAVYFPIVDPAFGNNDGQVKVNNGNGVKPRWDSGTASINGTYQQVIYAHPLGLSSSPTTSWPPNNPTPTDDDICPIATNTFLENLLPGQVNIWRIELVFEKNSGQTTIFFRIRNTLSGFINISTGSVSSGVTAGSLFLNMITIADGASLPPPYGTGQGYEMHLFASDGSFQQGTNFLTVNSIARISTQYGPVHY